MMADAVGAVHGAGPAEVSAGVARRERRCSRDRRRGAGGWASVRTTPAGALFFRQRATVALAGGV